MRVRVDCYSGYRGEETPLRFHLGQRTVEVEEVLDRWHAPDHRFFKIRGRDGADYILRHDESTNGWALVMYRSAKMKESGHDTEYYQSGVRPERPYT